MWYSSGEKGILQGIHIEIAIDFRLKGPGANEVRKILMFYLKFGKN